MFVNKGYNISLKRVQRLMNKLSIKSIIIKKFKPYSSNNRVEERENILNRDFSTTTINQKWVTDITYIYTVKGKRCYLATVIDLYTRKAISYAFSKMMDTELAIRAVENSYNAQKQQGELILR